MKSLVLFISLMILVMSKNVVAQSNCYIPCSNKLLEEASLEFFEDEEKTVSFSKEMGDGLVDTLLTYMVFGEISYNSNVEFNVYLKAAHLYDPTPNWGAYDLTEKTYSLFYTVGLWGKGEHITDGVINFYDGERDRRIYFKPK